MSDQNTANGQTASPVQEDNLEQYLLRGTRQVRQLLQELINARSLISIHLIPGGLSFLSTLLTFSEDEDWIFLDASPNETIHRRALESERMLCVTQLNKIRIQFRLVNGTEVPIDGRPTIAASLPEEILRLQRRDAFRLQVPLSHELKCILPALQRKHGKELKRHSLEAPVIDISAGGLSLEIPLAKTMPTVGDQINGCHLKLPNDLIGINLEVRNHGRRILSDGKEILRLGCSFVALPVQAANQIQRYIYQAEREISAHS
ncbi:MAG: flagellar brake protein [Azoarcus sp.]|nr:flagellar brake protein [Azoarcus sp.]